MIESEASDVMQKIVVHARQIVYTDLRMHCLCVSVVRGRVQNRRIAARQKRAGGSVSLHPPEGDQRNCCR